MIKPIIILVLIFISLVFFFCEFLLYYAVIYKCSWPELKNSDLTEPRLKAILLADTHLLGPRRGHWFDKLRREWQMHRAFQSAVFLLNPDAVFILGDLFDEGEWSDSEQFATYMARFGRLFATPQDVSMHVVPGNHDVGFHYVTTPRLVRQFHVAFNLSSVQHLNLGPAHFILVNSVAFEGDNCDLCTDADAQLRDIAKELDCGANGKCSEGRPILLQHFPMYRKSDKNCREPDEAPEKVKNEFFREKWDCLSKEASEKMYKWLNPRAIFTGHTHHGCHLIHERDIHEYTVPSFSWRNKDNPTFSMAVFTKNEFAVDKCFMPRESSVIFFYICSSIFLILVLITRFVLWPLIKRSPALWPFTKWKLT